MAEEKTETKLEEKKAESVKEEKKAEEAKPVKKEEKTEAPKEKAEDEKENKEKPAEKKTETRKVKKTEAVANLYNAHVSTKISGAVCKFIVGKTIDQAIADLHEVIAIKKPVPMKGEIPHRKGKIMSGRFPKKTAEIFVGLLKELAGNVNVNGLDEPIIAEAIANIGTRPYGKFGSVRRKRSHIKIIAKNKSEWKKSRSKKAKMNKVKKNSKNKTTKKNKE